MLKSIYPAYKCYNANNCWRYNIYKQDNIHAEFSWTCEIGGVAGDWYGESMERNCIGYE